MSLASVSAENIAIGAAAAACAMAWAIFILATLLGIGVVVGLAIVWAFATNS